MSNPYTLLSLRVAQAIGDPGSIAGRRLGPSWGTGQPGYADTEETVTAWQHRAVMEVAGDVIRDAAQARAEVEQLRAELNIDLSTTDEDARTWEVKDAASLTEALSAARAALGSWIEPQYGDLISPLSADRVLQVIVEAAVPHLLRDRDETIRQQSDAIRDVTRRSGRVQDKLAAELAEAQREVYALTNSEDGRLVAAEAKNARLTDRLVAAEQEIGELAPALGRAERERNEARAELARLNGAITWGTSCLGCAAKLDESAAETARAETEHPEAHCYRCGGPNTAWSAPSPLWNQVMRGGDIDAVEPYNGIICPTCFAVVAEGAGIAELWRLDAKRVHVPLQTVTPSGRVWDAEQWLWVGPGTQPASADAEPKAGA